MSRTDFPDEWIMVDQLKPVDLSNISDKGMQGITLLAVALGWNLIQRRGAPAQLKSRTGITRNIPTDTGVRQSVFWSMLANILGHSEGQLPTGELVDLIVKQTGMSRAHGQVLRSKVQLLATRNPQTLEPTEEEEEEPEPEPETLPDPDFTDYPTERVEPTLSTATRGWLYESPIMETVIRRLVPDGEEQITYRCKLCELEYPTKRGVGSHWAQHVQAGEAEATNNTKKKYVARIPDYVPIESHPRLEPEPEFETGGQPTNAEVEFIPPDEPVGFTDDSELRRLRQIVRDVQLAVGQDALKEYEARIERLQSRVGQLIKERDDAIARADRLASDLRSLKELLGGISDE